MKDDPRLEAGADFVIEKAYFESALDFSLRVSSANTNRRGKENVVLSWYVFTRICVTAETVSHLLERAKTKNRILTLDHYSIAVLCRNIIEASLMVAYLLEDGVSEERWSLRRKIFDLHNTIVKLRLFKGLSTAANLAQEGRKIADETRADIKASPSFGDLSEARQQKILSGSELYDEGLRSALRHFDIEADYFDGIYNYLSAQVHISSNSFYYTHKGRLDFDTPTSYQLFVASFAVANARMFMLPAALKYMGTDAEVVRMFDPKEVEEMRLLSERAFGDYPK